LVRTIALRMVGTLRDKDGLRLCINYMKAELKKINADFH